MKKFNVNLGLTLAFVFSAPVLWVFAEYTSFQAHLIKWSPKLAYQCLALKNEQLHTTAVHGNQQHERAEPR